MKYNKEPIKETTQKRLNIPFSCFKDSNAKIFNILLKLSWKQSKRNANIFSKTTNNGILFLNLKGSKTIPRSRNNHELYLSWKFSSETPKWKQRREINQETKLLSKNKILWRMSFFQIDDYGGLFFLDNDELDSFDSSDFFIIPEGYCIICGKDFQDEGLYCTENCRNIGRKRLKAISVSYSPSCKVCGKKIVYRPEEIRRILGDDLPGNLLKHHISYEKDITINVCVSCHLKIHRSKDSEYKKFQPIDKKDKVLNL